MRNPLLARFANAPVLLGAGGEAWLDNCMASVGAEMKVIQEKTTADAPVMAYDDFWPAPDHWLASYRPYVVQDGTLMIPIKGMLLHDFGYQLYDFATGYTYIQKAFERGMADGSVQRIAMLINSGGGEVAGCFDSVDRVYAMRGTKPIHAFVNESAYSAAFAWASVADRVTVTRTGGVGSVGVLTAHVDRSRQASEAGYKVTFVHAGEHKVDGNPFEALPAAVRARMQTRVDGLNTIFISTVARNLGLDEQVVRDTQALTYSAADAVALGFAHEVRAFDESLAAFSGGLSTTAGDETMPTPEQAAAASQQASQASLDGATATGRQEGAAAERERIQSIQGCEAAKTRTTLATHLAMNTALSVADATAILAASPEDAKAPAAGAAAVTPGADFGKAMGQDNPELGADGGGNDEQASAAVMLQEFRAANGLGSK